ncbi:MAG TPA: inositol monophosphatase family protein [Solirubrobacteraceae bacterium]
MGSRADDLELALELADLADSMTLDRFRAEDLLVESKPDLTPVTEADRAVERTLRTVLAKARPEDLVLGEEYGPGEGAAGRGRRWIVDPIDGTKNYVRGIPVWATLLALQEGEQITVGVASAPALHRRWWAARDAGAFMTDGLGGERRLQVSAVRQLEDAQLSFAAFEDWEARGRLESLIELGRRCWRTRAFGDFWGYMLVAEGAVEISCEPGVELWDIAVPQLIVEEAGGRFTDLSGTPRADGGSGLGTNGLLHEAALEIVGV